MTNRCDIWIAEAEHDRVMAHLFPGDGEEHGAVLRAGIVETNGGLRLVVREVVPAEDGRDYVRGQIGHRALKPTFIHREIVRCRDERMAYLAVHNHGGLDRVSFSTVDMNSHELGYPALLDIGRGIPVGALVYAPRAVEADVWLPGGRRLALGEYRIIGRSLRRLYPRPRRAAGADPAFDRQIRMFGSAGQAVLKTATVAVVGLGGVGSIVAEYLARLGVGEIILVDDDTIEGTNISRVVGATLADVEAKRKKTVIAVRHLGEAGSGTKLTAIDGDVARASVAAQLRRADYIFLAADSMRARLIVNALAHQYLIPVVQLGAKVRPDEAGGLAEAMSVIRNVRPGVGCLWCNGLIDPTQLAIEAKSDQERKDQAYGTNAPNPSVISLNAIAAAHGVNGFLFDFLGLRTNLPEQSYDHHHLLVDKIDRVHPRKDAGCRECVRRLGRGDAMQLPVLGDPVPPASPDSATHTSATGGPSPIVVAELAGDGQSEGPTKAAAAERTASFSVFTFIRSMWAKRS
jgi:hypothetical protein